MVRAYFNGKKIWDVHRVEDGLFTFRYIGTAEWDTATGDQIVLVDEELIAKEMKKANQRYLVGNRVKEES